MDAQVYHLVDRTQNRSYGIRLYEWVGGNLRQFDCVRIKLLFEFIRLGVPDVRMRPFGLDARLIVGCSAYVSALTEGQQARSDEKQGQIDSRVYPRRIPTMPSDHVSRGSGVPALFGGNGHGPENTRHNGADERHELPFPAST